MEVDEDGDATLRAPGLIIDFGRVPEAKTVKNRLHLDLRSSDLAEATTQALALGATQADDVYDQAAGRSCATPRATSSASSVPGPEPTADPMAPASLRIWLLGGLDLRQGRAAAARVGPGRVAAGVPAAPSGGGAAAPAPGVPALARLQRRPGPHESPPPAARPAAPSRRPTGSWR